jgi:hypothetical protein
VLGKLEKELSNYFKKYSDGDFVLDAGLAVVTKSTSVANVLDGKSLREILPEEVWSPFMLSQSRVRLDVKQGSVISAVSEAV